MDALLDQHFADLQPFLADAHLVALLAVQCNHLVGVAHRHDPHTVGACIGLDHHVGRLVYAVFLVFFPHDVEYGSDIGGQAILALTFVEVDAAADREGRIDAPGIDADFLGEVSGHFVIGGEMIGFPAHGPAGVERRQDELFVEVLENFRDAGRKVVVEQDRARVETIEPEAVLRAHQRFEQQVLAVGKFDRCRAGDFRQHGSEPHIEAGLAQDGGDLRHVLQVELVARVILGDQQQVAGIRADLFDRDHRCLYAEGQEGGVEVVEAAGEEVGVDRRQFEAGVAQVARRIEGRRVLLPLRAHPVLDLRAAVEEAALKFEQGAGEGGRQVGNHGLSLAVSAIDYWPECYTAAHKNGAPCRGQPLENR